MFDKLEDLLIRFEEIMGELSDPSVTGNQERFRMLMKEQSDLTPIVNAYKEYKKCKQDIEDSLAMLDEESDEDMREMIKETLSDSKKRVEELEQEMKILLLPKDCKQGRGRHRADTDMRRPYRRSQRGKGKDGGRHRRSGAVG